MLAWWRRRRLRAEYRRMLEQVGADLPEARYPQAEQACVRAVEIAQELHGDAHAELCTPLYVLGSVRLAQDATDGALDACRRAVAIAEKAPAATDPPLPRIMEQLAAILERRGELGEVERLYRKLLSGYDRMRAPDPLEVALLENRLALLLARGGRREEAAPLFRHAIELREEALGPAHAQVAELLYNYATFRPSSMPANDAEALLRRALAIAAAPGDSSAKLASVHAAILHNLAVVCEEQGKLQEAAPLYEDALAVKQRDVGEHHKELRPTLVRLARVYDRIGRQSEAGPLYARALVLAEEELGPSHEVVTTLRAWMSR